MVEKRELEAEESQNKRPRLEPETSQADQEQEVGITAFVSPNRPGFKCVVKQRYTDFLVNEINLDGRVVHLQSLPVLDQKREKKPPQAKDNVDKTIVKTEESTPKKVPDGQSAKPNDGTSVQVEPQLADEDVTALREIFGESSEKIIDLYAAVLKHPDRKPRDHPQVKTGSISEKSQRTQAHVVVRRVFQSKLESSTLPEEDNAILIKAAPPKGVSGARVESGAGRNGAIPKGRMGWAELGGEYLHFTLYKENKDTMEVLAFMGTQLKMPAKSFEFAGTKDRRGVTVQRVAVLRIRAERIAALNTIAKGWIATDFEYKKNGLSLGDLSGNEFNLTLRDCSFGESSDMPHLDTVRKLVEDAAESFRVNGFVNYYGLQRFGSFSTGTHMTGMKMLQGNLEAAVKSILHYDPSILTASKEEEDKMPRDDVERARGIKRWEDKGVAPEFMPRRFQAELTMMRFLSKKNRSGDPIQETDYQGALTTIARNLRLMYVHAYQSLVWNVVATKRWEMHGSKVVEGDLVIIGEKDNVGKHVQDEVDENGQPVFHPTAEDSAPMATSDYRRARPLTKEEAESGRYDIFDIVLPLPGWDVVYPKNELGKLYVDFMGSERGGRLDPHDMRRKIKDFSLSGGYRKMMSKPGSGFDVEVHEYESENEQFVKTDKEKLAKAAQNETATKSGAEDTTMSGQGKKIAVVLKFQLGSSQYATMALRELTKGGAAAYVPSFSASR